MNKIILQSRNVSPYLFSGIILIVMISGFVLPANACTVFILTDSKHTYFFNNEDFTNPNTRIWFIPKGKGHYGAAYVGYNDGEPQGGVNTKGLAFNWVTVNFDSYETDPNYILINTIERMAPPVITDVVYRSSPTSPHLQRGCESIAINGQIV